MDRQEAYKRAKSRVEAKIGFYLHLAAFLAVNLLLVIINYIYSPEYWWFMWPLIGWGIGLILHGIFVFVFTGSMISEAMIEKEMRKEKGDWGRP